MSTRNKPRAAPGVPTAARVFLLGEMHRQRVRWVVPHGPALRYPRTGDSRKPLDVTGPLGELTQPGWAYVEPWDQSDPPAWTDVALTARGVEVLMAAQVKARRRTPRKRPVAARPGPAARRRTYRPRWLEALRRYRPRQVRRRAKSAFRVRRDLALAWLLAQVASWWVTRKVRQVRAVTQIWWDAVPVVRRARSARQAAAPWWPRAVRRRLRRRVRGWAKPQVRGHYRRRDR